MPFLPTSQSSNIPLSSILRNEAQRIFDLIQQNVQNPKSNLTLQNLDEFLKKYFSQQQNKSKEIYTKIENQIGQLTEQRFRIGFAKITSNIDLTNAQSLIFLFNQIKSFFNSNHLSSSQQLKQWDDSLSNVIVQTRKNQITQLITSTINPLDGSFIFTMSMDKMQTVNFCLSILNLSSEQQEICSVYKIFINSSLSKNIQESFKSISSIISSYQTNINIDFNLIYEIFKTKTYLYAACRYKSIRELIQNTTCLLYNKTFMILIQSLALKDINVQKLVSVSLALLSKYYPDFLDWILSNVSVNFITLLKQIADLNQEQNIYYCILCLKNIMIRYATKQDKFKQLPENIELIKKMIIFVFGVLSSSQALNNQRQCLLLIGQLLKYCSLSSNELDMLLKMNSIYRANENMQKALTPASLRILEISLIMQHEDITSSILNDHGFKTCLEKNLSDKQSPLYCQFLHITYVLSIYKLNYLIEKGIFNAIFKLIDEDDSVGLSLACEIICNLVQQNLQNDKILQMLYEHHNFLIIKISTLLGKCFPKDRFLDELMTINFSNTQKQIQPYSYFNKNLLLNIFKTLYCLAVGVKRTHKRFAFSKLLDESIIESITKILRDLLSYNNYPLVQIILKSKIIIDNPVIKHKQGIHLFKIIYIILEEMTYNMEKKPISLLKLINQQKKTYNNNLLNYFTKTQLQAQAISVTLTVEFSYETSKRVRFIPHKHEFMTLRSYIRWFVAREQNLKEVDIIDFKILFQNRIIENEIQYKHIISKALDAKQAFISLIISDLRVKQQKRGDLTSSYVNIGVSNLNQSSRPIQNTFYDNDRRFDNDPRYTSRYRDDYRGRDHSRNGNYHSQIKTSRPSYQDQQPHFGYVRF